MNAPRMFVDATDIRADGVILRGDVAPARPHGAVFWEEATQPLRAVAFADGAKQVTVGVGPEGGLTAEEVTTAGLRVSLGMTILQTETAGVVAPALVLHRLGRLG